MGGFQLKLYSLSPIRLALPVRLRLVSPSHDQRDCCFCLRLYQISNTLLVGSSEITLDSFDDICFDIFLFLEGDACAVDQ